MKKCSIAVWRKGLFFVVVVVFFYRLGDIYIYIIHLLENRFQRVLKPKRGSNYFKTSLDSLLLLLHLFVWDNVHTHQAISKIT